MATATIGSGPAPGAGMAATPVLDEPHGAPSARDRRSYRCEACGHVLRVFGCGRHRVYFEPDAERLDDPVMDGACPECGRGLPGRNGASAR
jgi:hypothetical protein